MADSILSSSIENILGQLATLAVQEFCLAWGIESDLNKLQATVSSINAVLTDAEERRFTNHQIDHWLHQLRQVLFAAEDVVDDFAYQVLRRQVVNSRGGFNRKVRRFFSSSNPIAYRLRIGHKIKEIREKLDEINANRRAFELREGVDQLRLPVKEREMTYSSVNASQVIGRWGDREAIVKFLLDSDCDRDDDDNVSVIPIIGIGGLGKTALAKIVFDDQRVVDHFVTKAWACLGDMKEFNVRDAMVRVLGQNIVQDSNSQPWEEVLKNNFQNKRFLLVLDDIWDVNRSKWLEFKGLLAIGLRGSKILVTTRIRSVAECVAGVFGAYNLKGLPHKECVSLFKNLAFGNESKLDPNLMKIGDEIVRKCKGVPLAVRTLASHLFAKTDESEWLSVRDSGIWKIGEGQNEILAILKFSYDHLPSYLKRCFVYCFVYPEDYKIYGSTLVSFWMAHGLLELPSNKKTGQEVLMPRKLEDVGKQYINEFVARGFLEYVCPDKKWRADFNDRPEKEWRGFFRMHDLVLDLARSLSQKEMEIDRHVWVKSEERIISSNSNSNDNIRSVTAIRCSTSFPEAFLPKFNRLRFLWLPRLELEALPDCIGALKHLRCLRLDACRSLKRLPDSICKLHNLQTLSLWLCDELEELPENIGELVNLRWLCLSTKQKHLPKNGIESLTSLQFLWFLSCPNLETLFESVSQIRLTSLRTLVVSCCINLISLCQSSSSTNSQNYTLPALEILELDLCDEFNADGASQLLQLPNLKSLKLDGLLKLEALPDWNIQRSNTLRHLKIKACDSLRELPEWLSNLTSLQTLSLAYCHRLSSLPNDMQCLTGLQKVKISGCAELSPRCMKDEGDEWFKISHVPDVHVTKRRSTLDPSEMTARTELLVGTAADRFKRLGFLQRFGQRQLYE